MNTELWINGTASPALKIEWTVGTGFDNHVAILPGEIVSSTAAIESLLLNMFGGFSRTSVFGGWKGGTKVVRETCLTFSTLIPLSDGADKEAQLRNKVLLAQDTIRDMFRQTSVLLVVSPCVMSF